MSIDDNSMLAIRNLRLSPGLLLSIASRNKLNVDFDCLKKLFNRESEFFNIDIYKHSGVCFGDGSSFSIPL